MQVVYFSCKSSSILIHKVQ